MWVKGTDKGYLNLDNGVRLSVSKTVRDGEYQIAVGTFVLATGFKSVEDAQNSLDEFMDEQTFQAIQPPVSPEETDSD